MKTFIPDKSDDMFTAHDRKLAPEGLIHMFLEREENAKRLETKTGNPNMLEGPIKFYKVISLEIFPLFHGRLN